MKTKLQSLLPRILLGVFYMAALACYAALLRSNSLRIHEPRTFGDSNEYLRIANLPFFSTAFWTQSKPPITSLIYKLLESDLNRIFVFQLWFSIVCWAVLALAVAHTVRSTYLKPVAFALILAFSLSRDVFMWIPFIGSEAVSFSVTALFIASALWLIDDWKAYKIPFLAAAGFLMAFSRDTAAYILLIAAVVALPFLWLSTHRLHVLVIMGSFLAIFVASVFAGSIGNRFEIVFPIITAMRIFPNPEYVAFFKAQGMPVNPYLVKRSNPNWPGYAKWNVALALWVDPKQEAYRQWMKAHGVATYLRYLWFFKADTLQRMFYEDGGRNVFYPDVYYYTATGYRPILKDERLAEILYPTRLGLVYFFFANLAAALACGFAVSLRKRLWLVPIAMVLSTYPQAFLVWNGDANDIPRHSIGHNIMERLGLWILVLFVIDFLSQSSRPAVEQVWAKMRARFHIVPRQNHAAEPGE